MFKNFTEGSDDSAVVITVLQANQLQVWKKKQSAQIKQWLENSAFDAEQNNFCLLPGSDHKIAHVFFCMKNNLWEISSLVRLLPAGNYQLDLSETDYHQKNDLFLATFAWALGAYQYTQYRTLPPIKAKLVLPKNISATFVKNLVECIFLARDLINTPACDMTPKQLANVVKAQAQSHQASIDIIHDQKILEKKFPCLYAVGKGSMHQPCFIDMQWGDPKHPQVTLVGKGICYDTGGLDIKPSSGMRLMKKDMGGAAHALCLASLIMKEQLPIRLRLLIPAAENAISDKSYRPGDVIRTSQGKSIEIFNTDAEGRLVLGDALSLAVTEKPDCLIDFSTLTGAARVALGPDIPAFFCNNEAMAKTIMEISEKIDDPIWRLPLYQPYRQYLKSSVADQLNASPLPFAGAIVAALYLESFVDNDIPWAHFDMSAWNYTPLSGLEEGAEIKAVRAVFEYIKQIADRI